MTSEVGMECVYHYLSGIFYSIFENMGKRVTFELMVVQLPVTTLTTDTCITTNDSCVRVTYTLTCDMTVVLTVRSSI